MNEKISIIVPIYNAEKYLNACLDSIINQTYKNLEIICINDGSKDNSLQVLKEYELRDNRIVIIDKINNGVSAARNDGLNIATGNYIMFVDADDYLELNIVERLYRIIQEYDVDFVKCAYKFYLDNEGIVMHNYNETIANRVINSKETISIFEEYFYSGSTIWGALYKKSLIDSIDRFDVKYDYGEDTIYLLNVILSCKNMYLINEYLYNYNYNPSGACFNSKNYERNINNYLSLLDYLKDVLSKKNIITIDKIKIINSKYLGGIIDTYVYGLYVNKSSKKDIYKAMNDLIKNDKIKKLVDDYSLNKISLHYKIMIPLFMHNQKSLLYLYFVIRNILAEIKRKIIAKK